MCLPQHTTRMTWQHDSCRWISLFWNMTGWFFLEITWSTSRIYSDNLANYRHDCLLLGIDNLVICCEFASFNIRGWNRNFASIQFSWQFGNEYLKDMGWSFEDKTGAWLLSCAWCTLLCKEVADLKNHFLALTVNLLYLICSNKRIYHSNNDMHCFYFWHAWGSSSSYCVKWHQQAEV